MIFFMGLRSSDIVLGMRIQWLVFNTASSTSDRKSIEYSESADHPLDENLSAERFSKMRDAG